MPGEGWLIDTPGVRAVSLWLSGDGIERAFADVFDLMDPTSEEGLDPIIARLETIGTPYAGYRAGLEYGIARGGVVAERQVRSVMSQAHALAGPGSAYEQLIRRAVESRVPSHSEHRLSRAMAMLTARFSSHCFCR